MVAEAVTVGAGVVTEADVVVGEDATKRYLLITLVRPSP